MRALYYLLITSLKNTIKELKRKPLALIFYIVIIIGMGFLIFISFRKPIQADQLKGSQDLFTAIITGVLLLISYFSLKNGIEKGSSFFRMADVNLTFSAPISPKSILIYGFIKQLVTTIFTMVFFLFQLPSLRLNFGISGSSITIILISLFCLFVILPLLGIIIYAYASKSRKNRKLSKNILNGILFLTLGIFLYVLVRTQNFLQALIIFLSNDMLNAIPLVGWFRAVMVQSAQGFNSHMYLYISLIVGFSLLLLYIFGRLKTDYYEDVLEATEYKESVYRAKKEGTSIEGLQNDKLKKVHSRYTGTGAKAIFTRHMTEYRKTGYFLINRNTIILAIVGLASKFFYSGGNIRTVLYMTIYMLFFFSFQGKWLQETKKPYIYLFPSSSASKLFYATLADNLKNLVDGSFIFIAAGVVLKADILSILLSIIAYTSYGSIYIYGDVLGRRLFGEVHNKILNGALSILLLIFAIAPGLIISIIVQFKFVQIPYINYYSYLMLIGWNLLVASIILISSRGIFKYVEME